MDEEERVITVRLPVLLVDALNAQAKRNDRSVSAEVRHIIRLALTEQERQ